MSKVEITTLGKSCEFFNGKAHEKDIDEKGKYIVVNSKFISSDGNKFKRTNKQMFPLYKDDIVMVMSDVPNGKALAKCFIVDKDDTYSLNQRICCIRSKEFDTKYLYYQLNRHEHFLAFNNGENQTNLRKDDILDCPMIKPNMDEQKRMVKIFESAFINLKRASQNIDKNLFNTQELFDGYLHDLFESNKDKWVTKKLIELCDGKQFIVGGPFGSNMKVEHYKTSGIPILRLQNIGKGYFINKDIKYVDDNKAKELEYHSFIAGDIALAKLGIPIGKTCIIPESFSYGIVTSDVVRIRPNPKIINYKFLEYFLNTNIAVAQLTGNITGATRPRVNIDDVRNMTIQVPPINEQEVIVKNLEVLKDKLDILQSAYVDKATKIEELKSGILKRAFENELIEAE
jgi:type I restriction enzyme, S subunit